MIFHLEVLSYAKWTQTPDSRHHTVKSPLCGTHSGSPQIYYTGVPSSLGTYVETVPKGSDMWLYQCPLSYNQVLGNAKLIAALNAVNGGPTKWDNLFLNPFMPKRILPGGRGGTKAFIPSSTSTAICLNPLGDHLLTSPSRLFCSRISYLTRTCMEWDCGQPPSSRQTSLRCNGLGTL